MHPADLRTVAIARASQAATKTALAMIEATRSGGLRFCSLPSGHGSEGEQHADEGDCEHEERERRVAVLVALKQCF